MMPIVHLVRHGRIPDYETDRPLTEAGMEEAFAVGQTLAARLRPGETVRFFSSPARRARQTAALLRDGLTGALARSGQTATVTPIVEVDDRLQNLQFLLDGLSYDPIHPLFEVIRHRQAQTPSPHYRACADFHAGFWNSPDPMAYWLTHPSPAIEPPEAVAGRIRDYVAARLESAAAGGGPRRHICVSHSATLRAFVRRIFGADPGEPPYCGIVTISNGRVSYRWGEGETERRGDFK